MSEVTDEHGVITQDLYCLTCGYNLRGLSGDPVRCPECGEKNDLGVVTIPAEFIRAALGRMETWPTSATLAVLVLTNALVVVEMSPSSRTSFVVFVVLASLALWVLSVWRTGVVYDRKPEWVSLLVEFHIAAFLATAIIPMLLVGYGVYYRVEDMVGRCWMYAALPTVAGLLLYRRVRTRIAVMQRDAAVRIACETLRKSRHRTKQPER